jgi:hypothetical protein
MQHVAEGLGGGARFEVVLHDGNKMSGRRFSDLWEKTPDGGLVDKQPHASRVLKSRNMLTKRGLSFAMVVALYGHDSTPETDKVPSDITIYPDRDCYNDLVFINGDLRPEWDESDGEFDVKIPDGTQPNTVGTGKRSITLNVGTDGDFLRQMSVRYMSTSPYGEGEYVHYARQTQSRTHAAGQIIVNTFGSIVEANYFELDDGINPTVRFEFELGSGGTVAGNAVVDISSAASNDDVRDAIISAVNAVTALDFTASNGGAGTVDLDHDGGGTVGNGTDRIDITGITGGVTKTDMSGGGGAEGTDGSVGDKEIDNFPMKSVALAYGNECGATEGESQVALRSIFGLAPTIQGKCDRGYIHESLDPEARTEEPMHKYTGTQTITLGGGDPQDSDGWIESASDTEDTVAFTAGTVTITEGTEEIEIDNAELILPATIGFQVGTHERMILRLTGGSNAGDHIIHSVSSSRKVKVYGNLVTEGGSPTATLVTPYEGRSCFDGHVLNEGLTTQSSNHTDPKGTIIHGQKWVSADSTGPHHIGRIWNGSKTIKGIRIVVPQGTNKDFCPHKFIIQTLDPAANTNDPRPAQAGDWKNLAADEHDYRTANFQGDAIYAAGAYGVEYVFTTPVVCEGVKLTQLQAFDTDRKVEIAQLMVYEAATVATITAGDQLRVATDAVPNYREYVLPAVSAPTDYSDVADGLNEVMAGYEVEALRSNFGYLWLRSTVAGANSELDLDSENNGSDSNQNLGFTASPSTTVNKVGTTQSVLKRPVDALTIIMRFSFAGNHPQP